MNQTERISNILGLPRHANGVIASPQPNPLGMVPGGQPPMGPPQLPPPVPQSQIGRYGAPPSAPPMGQSLGQSPMSQMKPPMYGNYPNAQGR